MPACYLYPVIEEFRTKLEDEASKADDDVSILLKDLINRIDDRLKNHYDYFQLRVLYYLTPAEREHARNTIYKTFLENGQDGYHNEIKININYPKSDKLIKSLIKKMREFNSFLNER